MATSAPLSGDIAAQVACALCSGMLRDPRIFECGEHTFCLQCLEKTAIGFVCPICVLFNDSTVQRTLPAAEMSVDEGAVERLREVHCDHCKLKPLDCVCRVCKKSYCTACCSKDECNPPDIAQLAEVHNEMKKRCSAIEGMVEEQRRILRTFSEKVTSIVHEYQELSEGMLLSLSAPELAEMRRTFFFVTVMVSLNSVIMTHSRRELVLRGSWLLSAVVKRPREVGEQFSEMLAKNEDEMVGQISAEAHSLVEAMSPPARPRKRAALFVEEEDSETEVESTDEVEFTDIPKHHAVATLKSFAHNAEAGRFANLRELRFTKMHLQQEPATVLHGVLTSEKLPRLEVLHFTECGLRPSEMKKLMPCIGSMGKHLKDVLFAGNIMGDRNVKSLLSATRRMPLLNRLVVTGEVLGEASLGMLKQVVEAKRPMRFEVLQVGDFESAEMREVAGRLLEY